MTTFTTEDRILAEKDGSFTINVEGGTVTASPPHIVDSGASVIIKDLTDEEIKSVWSKIVCSVHITKSELLFARAILKKARE
jgi:hypothetical protein